MTHEKKGLIHTQQSLYSYKTLMDFLQDAEMDLKDFVAQVLPSGVISLPHY